jgi:hypothetical protein
VNIVDLVIAILERLYLIEQHAGGFLLAVVGFLVIFDFCKGR